MTDRRFSLPAISTELASYLQRINPPEPPDLAALRARTAALPFVAVMQGSPSIGRLLPFLIRLTGARRVLEVGSFTGCSTLAMAAALPPGGRIVAIERSEAWAAIGREFFARSGFSGRIDLRIGMADAVLDDLTAGGGAGAFDLAFVDADKEAYERYLEQCLTLVRDNGLMVFDNVLFDGLVPEATEGQIREIHKTQPHVLQDMYVAAAAGLRRFNDRLARDPRVDAVALPLADGVTLARKRGAIV